MEQLGLVLDELIEHEEEPGPRQRRPRPARRLLHGLAGDARHPGDRPRHPLRVRHLRSGDPRRLAGRAHRSLAAPRQPVGDPPLRDRAHRSASAATPSTRTDEHGRLPRALDPRARRARASPTTRRSLGYGTDNDELPPAVERGRRRGVRPRRVPGRRVLARGRRRRSAARTSPRSSTRTTRAPPASSCASSSSTSSSRARCRTASACSLQRADDPTSSPTSSRSSSTTRTRRSRCPS